MRRIISAERAVQVIMNAFAKDLRVFINTFKETTPTSSGRVYELVAGTYTYRIDGETAASAMRCLNIEAIQTTPRYTVGNVTIQL